MNFVPLDMIGRQNEISNLTANTMFTVDRLDSRSLSLSRIEGGLC